MNAVVFAYHNVGVRCLKTLLARGMRVDLVVTHRDDPGETQWFERVADVAAAEGIPLAYVDDAVDAALVERVVALHPDYVFSFYFRRMLPAEVLGAARIAALNMHGSLLPHYRGRAPVNWAVLHGEAETGATLHVMTVKPDAGDIVAQQAVPILPDDTAKDVLDKVTVAAEIALWTVLPRLLAGEVPRRPNDLSRGSYFGGRRPEDGRIDWSWPAQQIHDLVRAVAPPYPGAFGDLPGSGRLRLLGTRRAFDRAPRHAAPTLYRDGEAAFVDCADGRVLRIAAWDGDWDGIATVALTGATTDRDRRTA